MKQMASVALLSALFLASTSSAAPFDALIVSKDAKFIFFVDLEEGSKSLVGGWILERIKENPDYQQFEEIMVNLAGFMPASDIHDFTIYGTEYTEPSDASLVIRGSFDAGRLTDALSLARDFRSDEYNGHTLMAWTDEKNGKTIHACIAREGTIVMNGSVDDLKRAVDVMDDPGRSLAEETTLPGRRSPGAWAFAVGTELGTVPGVANNELLGGFLERGAIEVLEKDATTILTMSVMTETPQQAQSARRVVEGLKAAAQLAGNRRRVPPTEKAKFVGEIASKVTAVVEGSDVILTLSLENSTARQWLERLAELRER